MNLLKERLGEPLRPKHLAEYLGLDEKTVRQYYQQLGGVRLGRRILFFEKEVINAIQTWRERVAQVRKEDMRKEKVFLIKKEALAWEAEMKRKPAENWNKRTDIICLYDWAQSYLDFAKTKFSFKTYDEKQSMFRRFFQEVEPTLSVLKLTPAQVLGYIMKQEKERTGNAANKDRKNLAAGWNWGMVYLEPRLPSPNPCLVEKMPEIRYPRYVPPEEDFWRVYGIAEGQDKIMLLAFLHVAARRGEIFRLTLPDLDFENRRVRLWTRKRKDGTLEFDWLPMTEELKDAMLLWLENRPIKDKEHVFLCLDETPFCQEYYGQPFRRRVHLMKRLCNKAGVKPFGFHAIRHLSASILYKQGYKVATIQAILRHKSAKTTELYLESLGLEDVREALEKLSLKRGKATDQKPRQIKTVENPHEKKKPSEEPSTPQTARPKLVRIK